MYRMQRNRKGIDAMSVIINLKDRQDEVRRIAQDLHVLHKVVGGVCVLFIESDQCPFGFSVPANVLAVLPDRLRKIADAMERGVPVQLDPLKLP